tara:strand:- start:3060 stop:5270 length:2211 start_codon:yes stop_codon:yes gene_type:complete
MATTIQIKRSGTAGNTPTLSAGELGVNYGVGTQANAGDRLYAGTGSTVHTIGGKYFTDMLDQVEGTLTASSAVLVDSTSRIDNLIIGKTADAGGSLELREGTNNGVNYIRIKAPATIATNVTLTLPSDDGSADQYLQTNGSGVLSWNTVVSTFDIGADSGSDDTVNTGQLVNFTGGTGIGTTVADNEVTFAIDATVATLTGSQTLTNKTIALGSNTVSGTLAQFQTAITDATLIDLDDAQTLTNKTLTSPVITTPQINDTSADHQYVFAVSELAADRTVTLPLLTGNDEFTFNAHTQTLTNKTINASNNTLSNIANGSLTNSAVTVTAGNGLSGGGSVALGASVSLAVGVDGSSIEINSDALRVKATGITNAMLAGSITNAKLVNDDVTVGTTAIALGASSTTLAGLTQVDVDNIRMADNTISTTDADGDLVLSPNGTGDIDANTSKIINVTDPTADQDAATKAYVDAMSNGLDVKASVDVATTADLDYTYSNGTAGVGATLENGSNGVITLDGIELTANMRVLVKDQDGADADQNGIYYVSTAGASGVALVLTRATDADTAAKLTGGAFTFVEQGSSQQDNGYVFTHDGTPTIGTTNLPVSQFSGAGQITPGTGLTKSGNTINVGGSTTIIANADTLEVNSSGTNHQILRSGGSAGTAATFGQLALNQTAAVTGTLGYANGGTGLATFTQGSVLVANAADTLTALDGGGSNDGILFYAQGTDTISWATSLDGGSF